MPPPDDRPEEAGPPPMTGPEPIPFDPRPGDRVLFESL